MPPKHKADDELADLTNEQKIALNESKRLVNSAFNAGVCK